jgi:hypothetical protein
LEFRQVLFSACNYELLLSFFCLDAKERNKEKIKANGLIRLRHLLHSGEGKWIDDLFSAHPSLPPRLKDTEIH